jgi:hypothetical protein
MSCKKVPIKSYPRSPESIGFSSSTNSSIVVSEERIYRYDVVKEIAVSNVVYMKTWVMIPKSTNMSVVSC